MHGICFGISEDFAGDFGDEEVEAWFIAIKVSFQLPFAFSLGSLSLLPAIKHSISSSRNTSTSKASRIVS